MSGNHGLLNRDLIGGTLSISVVEPAGNVFAYTAENNIAGSAYFNVTTENLSAAGTVTHFPTAGPTITLINAIQL